MKHGLKRQPLNETERQTFHELYQAHHQRVYSVCLRMTQDVSEAEDLTQDVFVHLFRKIGSFRGESAFTTWLHRITTNIVLMHFRRRKRLRQVITDAGELPIHSATGRDALAMKVVDGILLAEVMAKLPDGYREAVVLYDIHGLDHNEIARLRGRTAGTSKSQVHKGRSRLRELITEPSRSVCMSTAN